MIDEKNLGRIPLDDFADISSWLGGYGPGARPGAAHPFSFSFGSVPDPRREDGWAGAMHFDTVAPRGEARFGKNMQTVSSMYFLNSVALCFLEKLSGSSPSGRSSTLIFMPSASNISMPRILATYTGFSAR